MSKLTIALEAEKVKFEKDFDSPVMKEILFTSQNGFGEKFEMTRGDFVNKFLTASNIRILSVVQEWARENKHELGQDRWISSDVKLESQKEGYNKAIDDLSQFIQEAITNNT